MSNVFCVDQADLKKISLREAKNLLMRGYEVRVIDNVPHMRYDFHLLKRNGKSFDNCLYSLPYEDISVGPWGGVLGAMERAFKANKAVLEELLSLLTHATKDFKIEKDRVSIKIDTKDRELVDILQQVAKAAQDNIDAINKGVAQ